jgi:hypothetical protein
MKSLALALVGLVLTMSVTACSGDADKDDAPAPSVVDMVAEALECELEPQGDDADYLCGEYLVTDFDGWLETPAEVIVWMTDLQLEGVISDYLLVGEWVTISGDNLGPITDEVFELNKELGVQS